MSLRRLSVFNQTVPPALGNIVLWLDASKTSSINSGSPADGDAVGTWVDQSSNGKSYTQATSTKKPIYKTGIIKGRPALLFDQSQNQYLSENTSTLIAQNAAFDSVFVGRVTSFPTQYRFGYNFKFTADGNSPCYGHSTNGGYADITFGGDGAITNWASNRWTTLSNTTSWHWTRLGFSGSAPTTNSNYSLDADASTLTRTTTSGNWGSAINFIGTYLSSTSHGWNGYIAEWIVYNKNLSTSERQALKNYMSFKYGL
jgi:hypothetical protein